MQASLANSPLVELDEWDDFVAERYKKGKAETNFATTPRMRIRRVTEFYRQNHRYQTLAFIAEKKRRVLRIGPRPKEHLGDGRVSEHAG